MIGVERISNDTRIIDLTIGEFKSLVADIIPKSQKIEEKRFVYGIEGIKELFHCSRSVACRIKKSGRIDKAISQDGRTIIVDANLAIELMKVK